MSISVSVIIPVHNEEKNIAATVTAVTNALRVLKLDDYELLICESGSRDATLKITAKLAQQNARLRVIVYPPQANLGEKYAAAVHEARKAYVAYVPGDNDIPQETLVAVFKAIGTAPVILPYTINYEARPWLRRIISRTYVMILNMLFGLSVRYYNGICIFPTRELQQIKITSHGFSYMAEIVVSLLYRGLSYREVPMQVAGKDQDASRALRLANWVDTGKTISGLFWRLRIRPLMRRT